MELIKAFTNEQLKTEVPQIVVGNNVKVHCKIKEGQRERIQIFEGTVIAKRGGGLSETFTVRRIAYGVGVEKTFPVHSPNVVKVENVRIGKVRRAKLYYLPAARAISVKEPAKAQKLKSVLITLKKTNCCEGRRVCLPF